MAKPIHKTVSFDNVPARLKKKFNKRYNHLAKKHPELTEDQIQDKIEKKLNVKFKFEE